MTESTTTAGKSPSHIAYQVRDRGEGKQGFFTKIGAAWPHKDGKGFNIQLDCFPRDGSVSLRLREEKND